MYCQGKFDSCGPFCYECAFHMKECQGHPDYQMYDGKWMTVEAAFLVDQTKEESDEG